MMNMKFKDFLPTLLLVFITVVCADVAFAESNTFAKIDYKSPLGYWKTIDDETGIEKSLVLLEKTKNNQITGKVVKILKLDEGGDPETKVCEKCHGKNRNKPIKGMTIMWGVKKESPDDDEWDGGSILDPKSGSTYKVKFSLDDNGRKLNVRGYIGVSLFGRTQVWHRITSETQLQKYGVKLN